MNEKQRRSLTANIIPQAFLSVRKYNLIISLRFSSKAVLPRSTSNEDNRLPCHQLEQFTFSLSKGSSVRWAGFVASVQHAWELHLRLLRHITDNACYKGLGCCKNRSRLLRRLCCSRCSRTSLPFHAAAPMVFHAVVRGIMTWVAKTMLTGNKGDTQQVVLERLG